MLRKKIHTQKKLPTHPPKSNQNQIVEYDIKSKYPKEYSTVDNEGGEKWKAFSK